MPFLYGHEVYQKTYPDHDHSPDNPSTEGYISYGLRFPEACAKHVDHTFHATKVYILASASLSRDTTALQDLKHALGNRVVGERIGMTPHTLWSECVEVVNACRELGADLIITLGAGSLTDAAKLIPVALANGVTKPGDLEALSNSGSTDRTNINPPTVPVISIPTSLSGGEFSDHAGATEDKSKRKYGFGSPLIAPKLVILDPELTVTTPDIVWLSSGIRAVDHCVETLCSLGSNAKSDQDAAAGLRALVPGLLRCKKDRTDLQARHDCQIGVILAMGGVFRGPVALGGSHAIGHMLGPFGVGHGETSCILLPAVCKYNAAKGANTERQQLVLNILWDIPEVHNLGLDKEKADLGDVLDAFIRALGLPRTLKAVGVEGEEKLDQLATNSLLDPLAITNPSPLKTKEDVRAILKLVAG